MKICLINPPSPFLSDQGALPPLGLFYIASSLENYTDVSFIDIGLGDIIPEDADIYCFTCNITQSEWCKENIPKYKKIGRTIIGGPYPTITYDNCGADQLIVGEGELNILKAIEYPKKTIFYGNGDLQIDTIPFPARRLCKAERYKYWINKKLSTPIFTSRGCPYFCSFCSKGVFTKVRFRSINNVIQEIIEVLDLGFGAIRVYDDSFICNYKRAIELLDRIKLLNIEWKAEINSKNLYKDELARKMAEAGCVEVAIGVESGSQDILNNINKQTTIAQHTMAVKLCKRYGIKTRAYLMVGLPGESWKTIKETKDWLYSAMPDSIGIGVFCPYPGSEIYNHPERFDIKIWPHTNKDLWFRGKQDGQKCFVSTSNLSRKEILEGKQLIEEGYN